MRQIVLLRGINLGPRNRVSMPDLRAALDAAGFSGARTYLQSGNVVLEADHAPAVLADECSALIARTFGVTIDVIVRSRDELAAVVASNPLADVAEDPKRYQVTFLAHPPPPGLAESLEVVAAGGERVTVVGREVYAWHPSGVARSKLWTRLASPRLGVPATSRNWTTVVNLLELADAQSVS